MATQALAIKYRPKTFDEVTEQGSVKVILQNQLETGEWKHAYLFCGGAGTGKTTCARIFANELNKGEGNPVELDAASNNGVDDVREIIKQAKSKPLDAQYKIFIIDECHAISNAGWQAFLKTIEEPPATSIFIFATTDPQKIPKTILSRVQRYDFQKISTEGIVDRMYTILDSEGYNDMDKVVPMESLNFIAKLAEGGMRDALTMLDKCIAYSSGLDLKNVVAALGTVDYDMMFDFTEYLLTGDTHNAITLINILHLNGKDLKQFIKQYIQFMLDLNKCDIGCDWAYITLPELQEYKDKFKRLVGLAEHPRDLLDILSVFVKLDTSIKYSATPKYDIEAQIILNW